MKRIKLGLLATLLLTTGYLKAQEAISDPSPISGGLLDAITGEIKNQLSEKWYEKLNVRGYIQNRYIRILEEGPTNADGVPTPGMHHFNNSSIGTNQGITIRRGRMIWSGNPTDDLYLYLQNDYNAGVGGSTVLQARDIYGDLFLDKDKEFRVRFGLSKVPYGFVNLQSSQNRLPLERPQALNSAVEGERDMGAYFIYAPKDVRALFRSLIKDGLRGSGDYGMVNLGVFNGQGINNNDRNGEPHINARFAYPFKFGDDQIAEVGASYYAGHYVPLVGRVSPTPASGVNNPGSFTPSLSVEDDITKGGRGVDDRRGAVNAIIYPKPFGLEAEWTSGTGPELDMGTRRISAQSLSGGYVQAIYRHQYGAKAELLPFVRWETFDGARKFATNAPSVRTDDVSIGFEWIPVPSFELTAMYSVGTMTNTIDNASTAVGAGNTTHYRDIDYQYLGFQAQLNF